MTLGRAQAEFYALCVRTVTREDFSKQPFVASDTQDQCVSWAPGSEEEETAKAATGNR